MKQGWRRSGAMGGVVLRLLAAALLLVGALAQAAQVLQFQPQGEVLQQSRATVRFDADMVRLGDATAAAPLLADCGAVQGQGRWIDSRSWAWQLERPLQSGERCSFRAAPEFRDLGGAPIGGPARFEFHAGGPLPRRILPAPDSPIDEEQIFIVDAGAPLRPESLAQQLWCEADGVGQRIGVRVLGAAERGALQQQIPASFSADTLLLQCRERLPAGARMRLVWGAGVEAAGGLRAGREQSLRYTVRQPFRATLSCERENASAPCSPLTALRLEFSAPVDLATLLKVRLQTPDGVRAPPDPNLQRQTRESSAQQLVFPGPLPQDATLRLKLPAGLKDDAGRPLLNADRFPLAVRTGKLPPLAKFAAGFGIVEWKEGGLLPVTLRNVEAPLPARTLGLPAAAAGAASAAGHALVAQRLDDDVAVIRTMRALARFEQQTRPVKVQRDGETLQLTDPYYARELPFLTRQPGLQRLTLPRPEGVAAFEVIGIPLGRPGYHVVEIESRLLGQALLASPKPMYVRSSALVTNLAVHLKRGRDNALVWVTTLDQAQPVAGAEVRVSDCDGRELWRGRSDAQGRALIGQALPERACAAQPARDGQLPLGEAGFVFASARLGEDYSFVRSDWNEGLEPWRFGVPTWGDDSQARIHTVFDRSLLRPGQTVAMKHIARQRGSSGFALPAVADLPAQLLIRHDESGTEYRLPLDWAASGSALSSWKIPESARRGTYRLAFEPARGANPRLQWSAEAEFRVGDFRLPVYSGSVQGVPARQVAPSRVPLALGLSFLNGGAARGAEVQVSATLRPRWPSYGRHEGFGFGLYFDRDTLAAFKLPAEREEETLVLDGQRLKLDGQGAARLEVALPQPPRGPSELYTEMSFTDPNGEIQTLHGTVELWPAALSLGLKADDNASGRRRKVQLLVLDLNGQPVAGQELTLQALRQINYSHRRRIVGGFYAYENQHEYSDLGRVCSGRSDARGQLECEIEADQPGQIHLLAQTRDAQGHTVHSGTSLWIYGQADLWFDAGNQDRIDVIPERRSYQPGETASFQVRTPFLEATALVAVEAGGVLESFVQPLSRFEPQVRLKIRPEWGPNVYVSVLAVRGRVEPLRWTSFFRWGWREPRAWFQAWWHPLQPTAMVDLARPAWRYGLGAVEVGTQGFALKVEVEPERQDYRPREVARVRLKVTRPDGTPAAGAELAFAGVDQALLELQPNESWNLLDALLRQRPYEVETATAQAQVIGKRHFGRKAVPIGGGGGRAPARELFDTLLLWQPRVQLDAQGRATLEVPINDSLSEFRLVGVATAGAGLFGTGSARIRTRQDLQLVAGLPPLVREQDQYQALLTLRNGTSRAMTVQIKARHGERSLAPQQIKLDPEGAAELSWPAEVPEGISSQTWEFEAAEQGGAARDRLRLTQQVAPAVPVTVQQATFLRLDGRAELPLSRPAGALPGQGGVELGLSARLSTPPPGLRRYLESYPFSCLEQRSSIAVGLNDPQRWAALLADLPALIDQHGLARYFPGEGPGSVALTAYLLDMAALSGLAALPEQERGRLLRGLNDFVEGRFKAEVWSPGIDSALALRLNALEALTRHGQQPTRAVAALEVEPLRLPTAALIDWWLVLRRLPAVPQRDALLRAAVQELRNRLSLNGSRLVFTTERSDHWWWLMVNGDVNAFRLIEAALDQPDWQDELPRLLQGALERQVRGHWSTTSANAWAAVTLAQFGRRFEREPVSGSTRASLGSAQAELKWPAAAETVGSPLAPLSLPWPTTAAPAGSAATTATAAGTLQLSHSGSGRPWVHAQVLAAVPAGAPRAFGYRLTRTLQPLQQRSPGRSSRGDLWRVRLEIEAEQDMAWVALSDPIPAGARILGDGDGRDSHIATLDENRSTRGVWPSFIERSFSSFNAYYELMPRGRWRIEYTLRLNNAGRFALPPSRIEAMYAPDVYGELPNAPLQVEP